MWIQNLLLQVLFLDQHFFLLHNYLCYCHTNLHVWCDFSWWSVLATNISLFTDVANVAVVVLIQYLNFYASNLLAMWHATVVLRWRWFHSITERSNWWSVDCRWFIWIVSVHRSRLGLINCLMRQKKFMRKLWKSHVNMARQKIMLVDSWAQHKHCLFINLMIVVILAPFRGMKKKHLGCSPNPIRLRDSSPRHP